MPSVDELRKMLRDARKSEVPISKMKKADVEKKLSELGLLSAEVAVEVPVIETKPTKPAKAAPKAAKAVKIEAPAPAVNAPVKAGRGKGVVARAAGKIPSAAEVGKKKATKSE
jgi:hypothetical protein